MKQTQQLLRTNSSTQLVEFQDVELEALKNQLKALETMVEALSEQHNEQLFLIEEFSTRLCLATGDILDVIHQLQIKIEQEKLHQKQKSKQASERAYQQAQQKIEELKEKRHEIEQALETIDIEDDTFDDLEEALDQLNEEIKTQQAKVRKERQRFKEAQQAFEETTQETFEEAKRDYEEFQKAYENAQNDEVAQLSEEEKKSLKKLYSKAARRCHPDKVADEFKEQATELMKQLNAARDNGDIQAIQGILEHLEKRTAFVLSSDQLSNREQIEQKIVELTQKLDEISNEIEKVNESEIWQMTSEIESWDEYFAQQVEQLEVYANQLEETYQTLVGTSVSKQADNQSLDEDYWTSEF